MIILLRGSVVFPGTLQRRHVIANSAFIRCVFLGIDAVDLISFPGYLRCLCLVS